MAGKKLAPRCAKDHDPPIKTGPIDQTVKSKFIHRLWR